MTAGSSIYFEDVVPISRDEIAAVERARKHARAEHNRETANGWIRYLVKADAQAVPADCPIVQVYWRSATDSSKGARVILLVRLRSRPVRIVDPESGTSMWLLYFDAIRGTRAVIKKPHAQRAARLLARHGLSWATLWKMSGSFLRGRRKPMLAALRDLRRLPK